MRFEQCRAALKGVYNASWVRAAKHDIDIILNDSLNGHVSFSLQPAVDSYMISHEFSPMTDPFIPIVYELPECRPQNTIASHTTVSYQELQHVIDDILSILDFSSAELKSFFDLPAVTHRAKSGKPIEMPAAYVRTRGEDHFKRAWMNEREASHDLMVNDMMPTELSEMLYPIHEIVLLSQCGSWEDLLMISEDRAPGRPPLFSLTVPAIDEFDPLLFWLHHHDRDLLHSYLEKAWDHGSIGGQYKVRGFCMNVRHLGVVDARLRSVVLSVLEPSA